MSPTPEEPDKPEEASSEPEAAEPSSGTGGDGDGGLVIEVDSSESPAAKIAALEAKLRVLKEMLPVVDNLERAVQHSAGGTDASAVLEGVKLVLRQFTHAFERTEVTAVEADGKPFDPNLHEAIGQQESDQPPGTVVTVLQRGYKLGDKLLRPALVVVAKPKATAPPETTDTSEAGATGETGESGEAPTESGNG